MSGDGIYECEVVIVGGGPVGVTLALLLGKLGIKTIVLEKESAIHSTPRAVGVDDLALRVWQACDVIERMLPGMTAVGPDGAAMVFYGRGRRRLVAWQPQSRRFGWPRGVTLVQPDVEETLRKALKDQPSVRFLDGHEVTEIEHHASACRVRGVESENRRFCVTAQFTVGCEGAHSLTRRAMRARFHGRERLGRWLIADVMEEQTSGRSPTDVEIFGSIRQAAVSVPRRGGNRRWEFRLPAGHDLESHPSNETIRELIDYFGGSRPVRILRSLVYEYHLRQSSSYANGRLALAGDAAHVMPPYAAQGLSCGLHDAVNLAWRLWLSLRHGADADRLMTDYNRERRAAVARSLLLSRLMRMMVAPPGQMVESTRDLLIRLGLIMPKVRYALTRGSMRIFTGYKTGSIAPGGLAGRILPQPSCVDVTGNERPLDAAMGHGFAALMRPPSEAAVLPEPALPNLRKLTVVSEPPRAVDEIQIRFNCRDQWFMLAAGETLVLRPDRVVLAHGKTAALPELFARAHAAAGLR